MASKPNGPASRAAAQPSESAKPRATDGAGPLIPFDILDAPTQRFYAAAVYVALMAWRLWDYSKLTLDEADSLWLFLKWALIDATFIYALPEMRIPWLEWSNATTTLLFLLHAVFDGLIMFRIPIPIDAWLLALTKVLYDRELSISERRVKPADILHNASLILGKQTIHILPEGSATLNPDMTSFCLDGSNPSVSLPIRINQTNPVLIELLRVDLDSDRNETIAIGAKQVKAMRKQADRAHSSDDTASPRLLHFPVKATGLYRLQRVVDESNLDVHRRLSDTLVVPCPRANVKAVPSDKCRGELSNFSLEVYGTPPLKIKYSRSVNREDRGFSFQSIQPENLVSPLLRQSSTAGVLVSSQAVDASWARAERIEVPLNESLHTAGHWLYTIEEVHDACGNVANYSRRRDEGEESAHQASQLRQSLTVHERPKISVDTYASQCSLKVARGHRLALPVAIDSHGQQAADAPYEIEYRFTPLAKMRPNGEHGDDAQIERATLKSHRMQPSIDQPGLYSLKAIKSQFCSGDVLEPATCLLSNPPEPDLAIQAEPISDKCAGNSIGLRVDLDLTGTPPFLVHYDVVHRDRNSVETRSVQVDGLRHQLEFRPQEAGHHVYKFKAVQDQVYEPRPLGGKNLVLEQDVKPPASAHFASSSPRTKACIEEPASFGVKLQGEGPWDLEYEMVYGGKRSKHKIEGIKQEDYLIQTEPLRHGGEYVLALVGVSDRTGCRVFLKEEAIIDVRQQRPKASFGQLEGKRSMLSLEGKSIALPVRLTGQSPWTMRYRNADDSSGAVVETTLYNKNDVIQVQQPGTYEIVDVQDQTCPGTVETATNGFEVRWIERPTIQVPVSAGVEQVGHASVKKEVCEGDEDSLEVTLTGTPPYHVKYEQRIQPDRGSLSLSTKEFTAGLAVASIQMETSQAGQVEYRFAELGDYLYDHDPRRHDPLTIQQRVHPRPSASFAVPGKTYRYCKEEEAGDEVIPIKLQGTPPFQLEIGIKHQSSARPEVVRVPNIDRHQYDFRIPHRVLTLGNHAVSVRNVRDAHGCLRKTEYEAPRVQVVVANPPALSPLDSRRDYCVGDRIAYTLSGSPPFNVFYTFEGVERKATSPGTNFRRIAEKPGNFTITALTDGSSDCKARMAVTKLIHPMPSVKISKGKETTVDIHEGGEAELLFEFGGTPPFEFTYTRSTVSGRKSGQGQGGGKAVVQETRHDVSYEHSKVVAATQEGTYEVVAIKDAYCSFSKLLPPGSQGGGSGGSGGSSGRGIASGSGGGGGGAEAEKGQKRLQQ